MSNIKTETLVIVLRDSLAASIMKDISTFALFAGLLYFNHAALDGNGWIDAAFILIAILILTARNSSRVFKGTPKDAVEWLQKRESC